MRGAILIALLLAASATAQDRPTMASVMAAATDDDWRPLAAENSLYMRVAGGTVVFELAPEFAPRHIENLRKLVNARYFDGLAVVRSQDNYVVQWGDPYAGTADGRSQDPAESSVAPEFFREPGELGFLRLDSNDPYADEVGFVNGFPAARDSSRGRVWLTHCYGMLGVGRANAPDSGSGAELYVVIGHAPRHLDRNVTLIGRVVSGIENLTTLPRGTGPLGFYEHESQYVEIESIRFGDELKESQRLPLELLRTDTDTFRQLVEARRFRAEEWFVDGGGRIGVCNVPLPTRQAEN